MIFYKKYDKINYKQNKNRYNFIKFSFNEEAGDIMVWLDDSFPYNKHKGIKFNTLTIEEHKDANNNHFSIEIDYCKELGLYRITNFLDGHWNGDIIFTEVDSSYDKEN